MLDRLTSETGTGYSRNWTWDANGNRLTAKYNSTTYNYTYVSGKNRLNTVSGPTARTYTYDAAGNIATNGASSTIGRTAYTYNARGRLVTTATRTSSTATASVTHYYNALGQRVRKTGADGTVNFIYDEAGHLVGEFNGSNALIQETAWLDDTPIAMLTGTSTVQYIHADHLNTPRVITNTAGTMQWWWNSDPFGHQGLNEDVDGNGTKVTYNPRFPGQYYDKTAATNYNYFRDYDPMTGRYLQSDPIGLAGGLNMYAYVAGNPARYFDANGLEISEQWHPVMGSKWNHVSVRITPCDQDRWARDERFRIDELGRRYVTIGAGPEFPSPGFGQLIGGINRDTDVPPHPGSEIILVPNPTDGCDCENENEAIERLLELAGRYRDHLNYDAFPGVGNSYNSNSYAAGLLDAAGIPKVKPPVPTPGWYKPVPANSF